MAGIRHFLKNNGLSLVFWLLFVVCISGQAVLGYFVQRSQPPAAGQGGRLLDYVGGPDFLKGVFGNWQAAILQLFTLIVFAVFLRQRGASHSRKPEEEEQREPAREQGGVIRRSGSLIYRNSLSITFGLLFAGTFVSFVFADLAANNAQRARLHEPPFVLNTFIGSAQFWFDVLQTWQAEFFAMGVFLVLSIFLRQENSAESKPAWATDDQTGGTNE